jgi:hypothetical protein
MVKPALGERGVGGVAQLGLGVKRDTEASLRASTDRWRRRRSRWSDQSRSLRAARWRREIGFALGTDDRLQHAAGELAVFDLELV